MLSLAEVMTFQNVRLFFRRSDVKLRCFSALMACIAVSLCLYLEVADAVDLRHGRRIGQHQKPSKTGSWQGYNYEGAGYGQHYAEDFQHAEDHAAQWGQPGSAGYVGGPGVAYPPETAQHVSRPTQARGDQPINDGQKESIQQKFSRWFGDFKGMLMLLGLGLSILYYLLKCCSCDLFCGYFISNFEPEWWNCCLPDCVPNFCMTGCGACGTCLLLACGVPCFFTIMDQVLLCRREEVRL